MIDWIVNRKLNLLDVSVTSHNLLDQDYDGNDFFLKISPTSISKLTEHNPNIKKLTLNGPYECDGEEICSNIYIN